MTNAKPTVLVCSGGGVYGAAQAGMILELAEAGFVPDVIVGVSAGAMNAVYMSAGFTPERARELADIWSSLHSRTVFPARAIAQAWNVVKRRDGVHPSSGLRALVERCSPYDDLADALIPTHVGAVAVNSGRLSWWDRGPVVDRLCASAAIPGVVSPVDIDGEFFFDGGVVANVPLHRALELGAARVVVLDISESNFTHHPGSALDVVLRAFSHARTALAGQEYRNAPDHIEVIRICGDLPDNDAADFEHGAELTSVGRAIAQRALLDFPELVARTPVAAARSRESIPSLFRVILRSRWSGWLDRNDPARRAR